ncbi:hypothetical protein CR513_45378, partial [Mucuna pruriens]
MIAKVLIDNRSLLNIMPKAMLDKLYLPSATLKNNLVVVRAFDGSKREVMGEITLPTCIGPKMLWIHAAGGVPSSLHQKVKFVANGQLISIVGEKELITNTPLPIEYIEGDEEALETSFQD